MTAKSNAWITSYSYFNNNYYYSNLNKKDITNSLVFHCPECTHDVENITVTTMNYNDIS